MPLHRTFALAIFALCRIASVHGAGIPNPYEAEMAIYDKHDRESPPRPGSILFLGGGHFKDWEPIGQDFLPSLNIFTRAFPGWSMEDSVRYVNRMSIAYQPRVIVLQAGSADLRAKKTPQEVLDLFRVYVATVHARLPKTRILFLSLTPNIHSWERRAVPMALNQLVAEYAAVTQNVGYIDLWTPMLGPNGLPREELFQSDSYLPSREGYLLRAKVIAPYLR